MKDLEKIKSEDLAAQVQDANPGNFAIEQEVAQLVGSTVPQPTLPSADDARELGAQLLVFLRRALLPIRSALRTAVAAIYAHLDSRCTAYTPAAYAPYMPLPSYDPMGTPPTPRTLPNLLTALTAFSDRKISNGSAPSDGIPDGTSLAHLLCSTAAANDVTEICDDNHGWVMNRALPSFPNAAKVSLGCKTLATNIEFSSAEEYIFSDLEALDNRITGWGNITNVFIGNKIKKISLPNLKTVHCNNMNGEGFFRQLSNECEILMPNCTYFYSSPYNPCVFSQCTGVTRIVLGKLTTATNIFANSGSYGGNQLYSLIDFEIGAGTAINLNFAGWNPTNVLADADKTTTFLQNFKEHIAFRLTANGSGKTLTLSQAVFSAVIEGSSPICDDIKGIIVEKGWQVKDTNNIIFPT